MRLCNVVVGLLMVCAATCAAAQETTASAQETTASTQETTAGDGRTQYPAFMLNSYFTFNIGSMRYIFSDDQLAPGLHSESIDIPHLAARVDLFGHHFTKNLSVQVTYMRPARYVVYHNVNGDGMSRQISTAYGGLTLVWESPLNQRISWYGEGGYGVTSRSGFDIDDKTALPAAHFAAGMLGAGLAYHATPKIDWMFGATYSPSRKSFSQPSTRLYTTGLRFHMRPRDAATVKDDQEGGFTFPLNVLRLGYTTNLLGYSANTFYSKTVPVFWSGNVETRRGFTLDYQRNVFHTKKIFAFDLGASASYWTSNGDREIFRTLSVYPLFRLFVARRQPADVYISYSLAGPTFLSQPRLDGLETGERFTFQDFMAVGGYFGKARRLNAELGIKHYSNGNIFTKNAGIKVPLTLSLGLTF